MRFRCSGVLFQSTRNFLKQAVEKVLGSAQRHAELNALLQAVPGKISGMYGTPFESEGNDVSTPTLIVFNGQTIKPIVIQVRCCVCCNWVKLICCCVEAPKSFAAKWRAAEQTQVRVYIFGCAPLCDLHL